MRWAITTAMLLLAGCGVGNAKDRGASGPAGSRSYAVADFNRVALRGADDVKVRVGDRFSVSATGPGDVLDQLDVEVKDGELRLGRKRNGFGMSLGGPRGHAVFTVTLPRLTAAALAGSGDMDVDKVDVPSFSGEVAGSGNLRVGALRADAAKFDIAGSGNTVVGGAARAIDVSIAGSGDMDAAGLKAARAKISIAGAGNVRAGVAEDADISIVGSGDVEIIGSAKCRVSKLGSGNVRCNG
jgi:hypothetical protein